MNIVVSGGYRTGTTHVYSICIHILERLGIPFIYQGANVEDFNQALSDEGWSIIKNHDCVFPQKYHDVRIIYCIRNPLDVIASSFRIGKYSTIKVKNASHPVFDQIRENEIKRKMYQGREDVLILDYDKLYGNDKYKIALITNHIGLKLTNEDIEWVRAKTDTKAANEIIKKMDTEADPKTQLRERHISSKDGRPGSYKVPKWVREELENIIGD